MKRFALLCILSISIASYLQSAEQSEKKLSISLPRDAAQTEQKDETSGFLTSTIKSSGQAWQRQLETGAAFIKDLRGAAQQGGKVWEETQKQIEALSPEAQAALQGIIHTSSQVFTGVGQTVETWFKQPQPPVMPEPVQPAPIPCAAKTRACCRRTGKTITQATLRSFAYFQSTIIPFVQEKSAQAWTWTKTVAAPTIRDKTVQGVHWTRTTAMPVIAQQYRHLRARLQHQPRQEPAQIMDPTHMAVTAPTPPLPEEPDKSTPEKQD